MTDTPQAAATASAHAQIRVGRRFALVLLMLVSVVNVLDRQVINILAEPIRRELALSDAQVGMMSGLAFALFYAALSLPIARLAERWSRPGVIALSMTLWSLFTAACGLAQGFAQLFAARVMVGVGEAGSGPASHALVSDLTPPERRASALGLVGAGTHLGGLIGLAFGGLAADAWGWRAAFVAAGAPGLLLACVIGLWLRDPRIGAPAPRREPPWAGLAAIAAKRSFWGFAAGSSLLSFTALAFGGFLGPLFLRSHGAELAAWAQWIADRTGAPIGPTGVLGVALGLSTGLAGVVGVLAGGAIADAAQGRDPRGYMTVAAGAALFSGPLFAAAALSPSAGAALGLLTLAGVIANAAMAPVLAAIQSVAPPNLRATASACLFLTVNFMALGVGPVAVGMLSDGLASGLGKAEGLRWALAAASLASPLAALVFHATRRALARDLVGLRCARP